MAPFITQTYYAATEQIFPPQHHNLLDVVTPDLAALVETGQTIPPQRYNPNDAAMTDVALVAENAGYVGRVCSRGSLSQPRSAQATLDAGMTQKRAHHHALEPNAITTSWSEGSPGLHQHGYDQPNPPTGWYCPYCGRYNPVGWWCYYCSQ